MTQGKDVTAVYLRLPADLNDRLRERMAKEDRTMRSVVEAALRAYLAGKGG